MTRLAVVMATYRGARYLGEQLASIGRQSRLPDHVVISDDGSDDGTRELIEEFAAQAPFPVTVTSGPQTGLADNFWHGLRQTDCDLVAWADQDDVWHPDKLAISESALAWHQCDLVTHAASVVDGTLRPTGRMFPRHRRTRSLEPLHGDPWLVPSGFASMFRRKLVAEVDFAARPLSHQTLRPMNHDHVVSLVAFAASRRLQLRDDLALYRQHGGNVAGAPTTTGTGHVRVALRVGHPEYLRLASLAREHGSFAASACPANGPAIASYFGAVAWRWERRAAAYQSGSRARRLNAIGTSMAKGDYASRNRGALGVLALARDGVELVTVRK